MLKYSFKFSKDGFSLVGVLVAAGLIGLVALVMSQMITNSKKAQTGVQNSIEFDIVKASVQQVLSKQDLCKDAFFAKDGISRAKLNPSSPPSEDLLLHSIKVGVPPNDSTIVKKGGNLGGGLVIRKLEFQNVTTTSPSSPNDYQAFLYIEGRRSTGGFGGALISNASNRPLVFLKTNASDEIIGCAEV